ncbi:hypothetical protein CVP04_10895 [Caviibacterium pharyngocola]|uniref:Uncharacterized protein n=1 Tax=Caviibacterium pharyngocola TaxID=28159 RepID=A0A2M8RTF0_9PAST|nr:hypothetical protein CVP04_10895 [Caviibacterium pharyngocola]
MIYRIYKGNAPEQWEGKYYLKCKHQLGNSRIYYLMYCNIIKNMPNGRLKIKVFGSRYNSMIGEKIRYVNKSRVISVENFQE